MANGIFIGGSAIKGIYIGSKQVLGVYVGSTKIYPTSGGGGGGTTDNAIEYISTKPSTNGVNFMQITNSHPSKDIKISFTFNLSQASAVQSSTQTINANTTIQWGSYNSMSNFNLTGAEFV